MSDKYYLHDCNSYTHCSQNTYRVERKDITRIEIEDDETRKLIKKVSWWQRLLKPEKSVKSQ